LNCERFEVTAVNINFIVLEFDAMLVGG